MDQRTILLRFVQALARALVSEGHHVEVVHCEDAYRLQKEEASVTPTPLCQYEWDTLPLFN